MTEFPRYEALYQSGTSAVEVYRVAKSAGMSDMEAIRMLRAVFGMSLRDAKETMVVGSGIADSLAAHEQAMADELQDIDLSR
jgi:ribosomal protein L7/L12